MFAGQLFITGRVTSFTTTSKVQLAVPFILLTVTVTGVVPTLKNVFGF